MKLFDAKHYMDTSAELVLSERTITAYSGLHWHDFFELEVVFGGNGTQNLNGTDYAIAAGSVYLLTPTDYHDLYPDNDIALLNIMFHETLLSDTLLSLLTGVGGSLMFQLEGAEFEELKALCFLLKTAYGGALPFQDDYIKNIMECILMLLLRKAEYKEKQPQKSPAQLQRAIRYIQMHFKENPSLAETAARINASPNYFSSRFKAETGMGYNEYLTQRKLSYAMKLLKSGDFTVTEVCFASGFTSMSNFLRVFKEKTGTTPSAYAAGRRHG